MTRFNPFIHVDRVSKSNTGPNSNLHLISINRPLDRSYNSGEQCKQNKVNSNKNSSAIRGHWSLLTDSSPHAAASDDTALAAGAPAEAATMTAAVHSMMSSMMRPASVSMVLPASVMSKMAMLPASVS